MRRGSDVRIKNEQRKEEGETSQNGTWEWLSLSLSPSLQSYVTVINTRGPKEATLFLSYFCVCQCCLMDDDWTRPSFSQTLRRSSLLFLSLHLSCPIIKLIGEWDFYTSPARTFFSPPSSSHSRFFNVRTHAYKHNKRSLVHSFAFMMNHTMLNDGFVEAPVCRMTD